MNLFSKMGDEGEGGIEKSQKIGDIIYGWYKNFKNTYHLHRFAFGF